MRTLLIAAASALFFAAVVTELSTRLWPDSYLALLLTSFVALFLVGLLNLKLAGALAPADARRPAVGGQTARKAGKAGDGKRAHKRADDRHSGGRAPEPTDDAARESGTVKWFNRSKGFGFVIRGSGEEIFVHQRSVRATGEGDQRRRPTLRDGQMVTFVVVKREKGLQAEDVVPEAQE